jgi:subtilisin
MIRTIRSLVVAAAAGALAAGCTDAGAPLEPSDAGNTEGAGFAAAAADVRDVPAVTMDLPSVPRPWDDDDGALANAVQGAGGHAAIAFKEPGSPRALERGRRTGLSGGTARAGLRLLETHDVTVERYLSSSGIALVRIDPAVAAELRRHPLVDYVEPNAPAQLLAEETPWGVSMVGAPTFWSRFGTGAGAKVMVIDAGHDQGHADLPAVPTANCGGLYGGCTATSLAHGTHVLGILTARQNGIGVRGVARGAAASDVYVWGACSQTGSCDFNSVAAGLDAAVLNGVEVVNMSLGGTVYNAALANSAAQAWAADVLMVAAAGNNQHLGYIVYPAALSQVIGVSGVQSDRSFANWSPCVYNGVRAVSNYGSHVELSAPFWAKSTVLNDGYGTDCGTSMASPHVAGAAALVRASFPNWSATKVRQRLTATAEDRGTSGWDQYFGHGIVNAYAAMWGLSTSMSATGPGVIASGDGYVMIASEGTYTFTVNIHNGTASSYYYRWTVQKHDLSLPETFEGGSSYSRYITGCDGLMTVKVEVRSANEGWGASEVFVENYAPSNFCY